MRAAQVSSVIIIAGLATAGCSKPVDVTAPSPSLTPTAVSDVVSKATWKEGVWPFTVPDGVVKCYIEDSMITFTSEGVEYGLNVTARRFGDFPDIDEIAPRRSDGYVEIEGTRQPVRTDAVGLDEVLSYANKFCSKRR